MIRLTTISVTPQARPGLFKRAVAWLLMATISTSSLAQAVGPIIRGPSGAPLTGYTANGTYVQNGQVVGNPHQRLHDLINLNSVKPSISGYVSKTKLCEAATVQTDTLAQRLMISDVVANGDKFGVKTESLVNDVIKSDPNIKVLDGTKYRGENGHDHVVQFVDPVDGITKTMVIDSKQLAINGSTSLGPRAAGGVMQLSDASLRVIGQRLTEQGSPVGRTVQRAIDSQTLVKAVAFVDKSTGELKIVRVDVPNTPSKP